jgi:hypothetical protein
MLSILRYVLFGALALACVQTAQAAVVNLTGMHQQFVQEPVLLMQTPAP